MNALSVTVVVPLFNSEHTIARALASVVNQTKLPQKIIIVDDCSTDRSVCIAKEFLSLHSLDWEVIENEVNRGPGYSRNKGMDAAKTDLIAFLDSDDTWTPSKLEIQVTYFETDHNLYLCGHGYKVIGSGGCACLSEEVKKEIHVTKFKILARNWFPTPSVMLRNEDRYKFKEDGYYSEDYYLWMRIILEGKKALFLDSSLFLMYKPAVSKKGLSSNLHRMQAGELSNYRKLYTERLISLRVFLIAIGWSMIKYFKRIIVMRFG